MRLRILLVALLALSCWQPAFAQEFARQQEMLASAARTTTTYSSWIKTFLSGTDHARISTIWCYGNVSVSNETGTLRFGFQACDPRNTPAVDCSQAATIFWDATHLAVVARQFAISTVAISASMSNAFTDTEGQAPIPPYFRIVAEHASSNESTYSVDCTWW